MTAATSNDNELRVFISYRRSDCQPQANGLHDGLRHRLPGASVFMDIDSIPYGVDFEQHIRAEINKCDVVLVLIGDNWLDLAEATGRRRLDEPDDFVRLEIENALAVPSVRVVPVLVEGASMPRQSELPESIQRLARLNAIELSDRRWTSDLRTLAEVVDTLARQPVTVPEPPPARPPATIRLDQVEGTSVTSVVRGTPEFQTKDISEHPDVLAAHGALAAARNYHAMIGSYISRNCASLGVRSVGRASNGRGERWAALGPSTEPPRVPATTPRPEPVGLLSTTAPPALTRRSAAPGGLRPVQLVVRAVMIALPILMFGLLAWIPPVWAAVRNSDRSTTATRLYRIAGASAALMIVGIVLFGVSPEDAHGTATGPLPWLGFCLLLAATAIGTATAIRYRDAGIDRARRDWIARGMPDAAAFLINKEARQQYREMSDRDPALAREMGIGRPDRVRDYDDGGLLDLNSLPVDALVRYGQLGRTEAAQVTATRERLGRLSSVDELIVYADVDPPTAERLRDYAVFL